MYLQQGQYETDYYKLTQPQMILQLQTQQQTQQIPLIQQQQLIRLPRTVQQIQLQIQLQILPQIQPQIRLLTQQ